MTRRYDPHHKALVLATLRRNGGDIPLTSQQTSVPQRTLRHWRQQTLAARQQPPASLPPENHLPLPPQAAPFTNDNSDDPDPTDQFFQLRQIMMREALTLAGSLASDMAEVPVSHRASALTRLVDRILKLDDILPRWQPSTIVRHEFRYPDGTMHDVPPWQTDSNHDEDDL